MLRGRSHTCLLVYLEQNDSRDVRERLVAELARFGRVQAAVAGVEVLAREALPEKKVTTALSPYPCGP